MSEVLLYVPPPRVRRSRGTARGHANAIIGSQLLTTNGGSSAFAATCLFLRYRGTSLIRKRLPVATYSRPVHSVIGGSYGGGRFLLSEVPLYVLVPTVGFCAGKEAKVLVKCMHYASFPSAPCA